MRREANVESEWWCECVATAMVNGMKRNGGRKRSGGASTGDETDRKSDRSATGPVPQYDERRRRRRSEARDGKSGIYAETADVGASGEHDGGGECEEWSGDVWRGWRRSDHEHIGRNEE